MLLTLITDHSFSGCSEIDFLSTVFNGVQKATGNWVNYRSYCMLGISLFPGEFGCNIYSFCASAHSTNNVVELVLMLWTQRCLCERAHAHPCACLWTHVCYSVWMCVGNRRSVELRGYNLWCSAGYNSFQTKFPACVVVSFPNDLDRMESTTDVPCLKTDIFGRNFWIFAHKLPHYKESQLSSEDNNS